MDDLRTFILNESLDPPLVERAETAARAIDPTALETLNGKSTSATDVQRGVMRDFLTLAGIEFDDEGWSELQSRPDMQQLLAAALSEGVIHAKKPKVTVAFIRIRACIELALREPSFPEPEPEAKHEPVHAARERHPAEETPARAPQERVSESDVMAFLEGPTVDWSGIDPNDLPHAKACMKRQLVSLGRRSLDWYAGGIEMRFIRRMKQHLYAGEGGEGEGTSKNGKHTLCYAIEERNGAIARLDGIFRKGDAWYVSPLPTDEMNAAELID